MKTFPGDDQTSQAKSSSQPANLHGAHPALSEIPAYNAG